jgi:hypothetical protein
MELERAVDEQYRPQKLQALHVKVEEETKSVLGQVGSILRARSTSAAVQAAGHPAA